MAPAVGRLLTKIVYAPDGFSNVCDKVTYTATTGNANTVITDICLLFILTTPASLAIQMQDPAGVWSQIIAAGQTGPWMIPSDGHNFRITSADTSTNRSLNAYVIQ